MSRKTMRVCDGCGEDMETGGYSVSISSVVTSETAEPSELIDVHGADCLIRWVRESRKIT